MSQDSPKLIRHECEKCNKILGIRADQLGRRVRCPSCRHGFILQGDRQGEATSPPGPAQDGGPAESPSGEWLPADEANELTRPTAPPSPHQKAKITATFRRPQQVVFQAALQVLRNANCEVLSIDHANRHLRFSLPAPPGQHSLFVYDGPGGSCEMDVFSNDRNENGWYDQSYQMIIREMGKYLLFVPESDVKSQLPPSPAPQVRSPPAPPPPERRRPRWSDYRREGPPRRERRRAKSGHGTLILMVILGAVIVVPILALGGLFLLAALAPNNARCPVCGKEFNIPEDHRGNISMWSREYRCPRCGEHWPPAMLYKK